MGVHLKILEIECLLVVCVFVMFNRFFKFFKVCEAPNAVVLLTLATSLARRRVKRTHSPCRPLLSLSVGPRLSTRRGCLYSVPGTASTSLKEWDGH